VKYVCPILRTRLFHWDVNAHLLFLFSTERNVMKVKEIQGFDQTVTVKVSLGLRELIKIGIVVAVVETALHWRVSDDVRERVLNKTEEVTDKLSSKLGGDEDEPQA